MEPRLITMLKCREVARSIASDEQLGAGWRRRLPIKLHLLACRHCRRYARQIRAIGKATRQILGDYSIESNSREALRNSILKKVPSDRNNPSEPDG